MLEQDAEIQAESAVEFTNNRPQARPEETARTRALRATAEEQAELLKDASPQPVSTNQPVHQLQAIDQYLSSVYNYFRQASIDELVLSYSSEWILDNDYIIRQAIHQVKESLSDSFNRQLPRLTSGTSAGLPRVYLLARALLEHARLKIDFPELELGLGYFQDKTPLSMGEIWAIPIFLRLVILECLVNALGKITSIPTKGILFQPPLDPGLDQDEVVASSVIALRQVSNQDWNDFFESVSLVNRILSQDPAEIYRQMDFKTRDLYRKAVEELAAGSGLPENEVAQRAIEMAEQAANELNHGHTLTPTFERNSHVGFYLRSFGRQLIERSIGYHPGPTSRIQHWVFHHATVVYVSSISILSILVIFLTCLAMLDSSFSPGDLGLIVLVMLIPSLTIGVSLVNWAVTTFIQPDFLPKLEFKDHIPEKYSTIVVVPALLTSEKDVGSLVKQIEMHYLRNPEPGIFFGLLTDFEDSAHETCPGDQELIDQAIHAVQALNNKYQRDGISPFFFFHRKRLWNPSENTWMGWERKRGKLHELNRLLRGSQKTSFSSVIGDIGIFPSIKYVITLDADTILPSSAARRLIGALAHPLNRAIFNQEEDRVISGYTVLQPRVDTSPGSANTSWFSRIYTGDSGLDLYSIVVSDVYQDLLREGIFVGKGIYDLDAFEKSVDAHIPHNMLLSHDLLEGLLGRAGLVSDISLVEDYPSHYLAQVHRMTRWIRGDWQLLPWLVTPGKMGVHFSGIDRWKIIDNLRRSLLAPALLFLFLAGWIWLPGSHLLWTFIGLATLGIPVFTSMVQAIIGSFAGQPTTSRLRTIRQAVFRWLLAILFLPFEALSSIEAILVTLYRLLLSRKYLLQWTSSARTNQAFGFLKRTNQSAVEMVPSVAIVAIFLVLMVVVPNTLVVSAIPLLVGWTLAPLLAEQISRPFRTNTPNLNPEQVQFLRMVARKTWSFFEHYVGPEDHWLPPDHFQESPLGIVAHRTSPTNIGLLLNSTLAAYDFGYLDQFSLITRLTTTLETLAQLESYRGHFLNWYDTRSLQALPQRYVSTVDSGNLAASLIVTAQACLEMASQPVLQKEYWRGYLDTLSMLEATVEELVWKPGEKDLSQQIHLKIDGIRLEIQRSMDNPNAWYALFQRLTAVFWKETVQLLAEIVQNHSETLKPDALRSLLQFSRQIEAHHEGIQRTLTELTPWVPKLAELEKMWPVFFGETGKENLQLDPVFPINPELGQISEIARNGHEFITRLREELPHRSDSKEARQASNLLDDFARQLQSASINAGALLSGYTRLAQSADLYVQEMDFAFLYNPSRKIFHLGYNLDTASLDQNFYDLLASEARIASLVAISKRDVPQQHWLYLSRPVTQVDRDRVLLSWSGTMFEYLMPPLFLRSYPGTLLHQSSQGAIKLQMEYAHNRGVPWGISESGYYRVDNNQNYQYRAFGVPGLGLKRGLADDLVIAPYASLMAAPKDPIAVFQNAVLLNRIGLLGLHGFFEAIDYTQDRLRLGEKSAVVRSYMAHHQGMVMLALANWCHNDIMVERMHANPMIKSIELLLQEQVPYSAPIEDPRNTAVMGNDRISVSKHDTSPWIVPLHSPIPIVHLISNGNLNSFLSNSSSGYLQWEDIALTRWSADAALDSHGIWIYVEDLDAPSGENRSWSIGNQPMPEEDSEILVTNSPHMSMIRRIKNEITTTMDVTVHPEDDIEIRRIQVHNFSTRTRRIRLTSYGEVILSTLEADARHPAFNKMFIESEFVPEINALFFRRRPRSSKETPLWMGHMLVNEKSKNAGLRYETDRSIFLGRNRDFRNPEALFSDAYLSNSTGATLDPIFSIGFSIELKPYETRQLAFLTFAAHSREDLESNARRFQDFGQVNRAFDRAANAVQANLRKQELTSQNLETIDQIYSALVYPFSNTRAPAETISSNRLGQPGLWPYGISGDYPIFLVRISEPQDLDLVREAIQTHHYWRERRVKVDLVILNEQAVNYGAELNNLLYRLISRTSSDHWLNQRGGIYLLFSSHLKSEEKTLLETTARVVLSGERGSLQEQIPGYSIQVTHLPAFSPSRMQFDLLEPTPPLPALPEMKYRNSPGTSKNTNQLPAACGFSADGKEYIIQLEPGQHTPAPWVNVIGYPEFGFLVTETGSSTTWAANSGENRLSPWFNDSSRDPSGEVLYLRDEETGEVWTPTPMPAGTDSAYRIRHGFGYTIFEHHSHGLRQQVQLFASPTEPIKIIQLKLENTWTRPRRITATQYVEWVLGTIHAWMQPYILSEYDPVYQALLAINPYNTEFNDRVAFLAAGKAVHGYTADRVEFIGRGGSLSMPAGLRRIGLESRVAAGEDACGALQVHIDLGPGESEVIYFLLGEGSSREQTHALIRNYQDPHAVQDAWQKTQDFWHEKLEKIQVNTPDPAMNLMLNGWLLYQTLSCRIFGRTAFYQSSGAYGFRDQLQDVMALIPIDPSITREHIIESTRHQFDAGDVLHWWHPPSGRGIRTRISDDLLWLPYVVSEYFRATGDASILTEQTPFLTGDPLKPGEEERYGQYFPSQETFDLQEHCRRAIERGTTFGPHNLPLMGTGDWNDGMNHVGAEGRGESVWLAWFLYTIYDRFASVFKDHLLTESVQGYQRLAKDLSKNIDQYTWDGAWYVRAFYDNGTPLGSVNSIECQIDSIAQSWAVLSKAATRDRAIQAMKSVLARLVREDDRLILLFTPPFDQTQRDPGYIKGYVPGIRENGGQYTHGATWAAWAFTELGQGNQAMQLFNLLNPVYQADSPEKISQYKVEPYVIAADIYSTAPHVRRGGWTWYTGSSGWMYRLGLQAILGFQLLGDHLVIDPVIPSAWDRFAIDYRVGPSTFHIQVENPEHVEHGVTGIWVNEEEISAGKIPLKSEVADIQVRIRMGENKSG
jgi:cyclic beta-1,2-glucan synthetase